MAIEKKVDNQYNNTNANEQKPGCLYNNKLNDRAYKKLNTKPFCIKHFNIEPACEYMKLTSTNQQLCTYK